MKTQRTPLYEMHREYGGRLVDFAGWELPVQYESALEEHRAVRTRAAVFDVSHMGQIEIRGPDTLPMTQSVTCNDVSRLSDGQAQYSAFLSEEGTFIDDIVVYRFGAEQIFICVNAATCEKDLKWLNQHKKGRVEILDRSRDYAQLAVQGPVSEQILQKLTDSDLTQLKFYRAIRGTVGKSKAIISRTGYTGEDGFEIYLAPGDAERCWRDLFEAGRDVDLKPAGLAARNSLRLEMRYPLYGNDIDESHTPYEAGLGWIVKAEKEFLGRRALEQQMKIGPDLKLMGFELTDRGIVRDGCDVLIEGNRVGKVTSGGFSPSLEKSIGLVYLPAEKAIIDQLIEVDIRGRLRRAVVVKTPFYKRPS